MKYKILIVEDEKEIIQLITNRLDHTKYEITIAQNGSLAQTAIEHEYFDLITLDIMLPHVDGLTLCNQARLTSKETLIVIISALDLDESKEKAYTLGADDYVAKPFSAKLLALKIETLLKRRFELTKTHNHAKKLIKHDPQLKSFYIQGQRLQLTLSEYTILESLYNNAKKVFSKDELSQILYDLDVGNIQEKGVGTHIYTLRKKIAQNCDQELIKTIRGIGYTLHET